MNLIESYGKNPIKNIKLLIEHSESYTDPCDDVSEYRSVLELLESGANAEDVIKRMKRMDTAPRETLIYCFDPGIWDADNNCWRDD